MNITKINTQPEFRGKICINADGPKKTYDETIDAKDIKKIYFNEGDRFSYLFFNFLDNNNETYRQIIIGDYDTKHEDIRNRYMRFLKTYSIALQAPDDVIIDYVG